MIINMYAVKDDLIGFAIFGDYVTDEVAIRAFNMSLKQPNVPVTDLSLYRTGSFDTETGDILDTKLEFICRGKRDEEN